MICMGADGSLRGGADPDRAICGSEGSRGDGAICAGGAGGGHRDRANDLHARPDAGRRSGAEPASDERTASFFLRGRAGADGVLRLVRWHATGTARAAQIYLGRRVLP